jgi:DNA-binding NarL/FixJ family response regulator
MIHYVAIRILVVDDSPHFRTTVAELLAMRGFELLEQASDGEQAVAVAARTSPDGVLLDVDLPGPDGFAVAELLAAACPTARIVLTSAALDYFPADAMKDSAAIAFLPKHELAVTDLKALFVA